MFIVRLFIVAGIVGFLSGFPGRVGAAASIDFRRDIQPIFEQRCYECHGEKKQKSGLRLDVKSNFQKGGDSGKAPVLPGKPAESQLLQRLLSSDPDEMMPPKGDRLSEEQISRIRTWIEQGANWPEDPSHPEVKHWSYLKPVRPPLPRVQNKNWPQNGIDYFVLEKLERGKLAPSPEADRVTLLRRVSLDLTGLPPAPSEVAAFLADKNPGAYERAVDRLLASPRYGERWARPWLDLARYADTQGYEKDNRRTMWPYRDWVINALNKNITFKQFTIEQIAGDLLPNASRDQKVATGFHRNTMTNTEGGTDDEEFRHEAVVDRVNTTMLVWMGTTMGCAQCHNHKYDPITTKEYYQLYAILNNTADSDKDDERPTLKLPSPEQEAGLKELREKIATAEKGLKTESPAFNKSEMEWEAKTAAALAEWKNLEPSEITSTGGATLTKQADKSILAGGNNPSNDVYVVKFPAAGVQSNITALRLEVLPDSSLPQKSFGRSAKGDFILNRFEAVIGGKEESPPPVIFKSASADDSAKGQSVSNLITKTATAGWSVSGADEKLRIERSAYFFSENAVEIPADGFLIITLRHQSKEADANLGRFRISATAVENPKPAPQIPSNIRKLLSVTTNARSEAQRKELSDYYRTIAPELKPLRDELAKLRKSESDLEKAIPISSVMEELATPRETHLHIRGSFLSKGEKVEPGVPSAFHPIQAEVSARVTGRSGGGDAKADEAASHSPLPNRLDLARWLVSEENPLTARVTMNRFWEQYFGVGIVETSEDFGKQGELPSNQKLLDWLATEFMRVNWDMKAMHKTIVMSATYRQSARVTPALYQRDPYNRLLARGPRVRLDAETLRDQALAVSGLLREKIGGPSVMPPQPEGIWQVVYNGDKWETSQGGDKYRRSLYTFWRRTIPHPAMTTFDAPSREFCVVRRARSNTPLQALTVLNDPEYVEAAEGLARRVTKEGGDTLEKKLDNAIRLCLARSAKPGELARLRDLFDQERLRYQLEKGAAEKLATQYLGKAGPDDDLTELAAWTVVANVLLNLDEMITKG